MTYKVRSNNYGTMAPQYSIGKNGPTIYQGTTTPLDTSGNNGDLYLLLGAQPRLFVKQPIGWTPSSDPSLGYVFETVTANNYTLSPKTTYAGVNLTAAGTLNLPTGTPGRQVTIKDEGGSAGTNTITVAAATNQTIDGQPSWAIDINYGSLVLVYGSTQWHLVSAITSSPYNTMKM